MSSTYVFRPLEANLTRSTELLGRMSPYVVFVVGTERISGPVCPKGGKHPVWQNEIAVPLVNNATTILVEVMDKDRLSQDDLVGSCMIDLREIQTSGGLRRSYPLVYKGKPAGELVLEGFLWGSPYASKAYPTGVYGSTINYSPGQAYLGGQAYKGSWNLNQQNDFYKRYQTEGHLMSGQSGYAQSGQSGYAQSGQSGYAQSGQSAYGHSSITGGIAGGSALGGGLTSGGMSTTSTSSSPFGSTTYIFRPMEARLTHSTELLAKMSPYVAFVVGDERITGPVCPKGAKNPVWNTEIAIPLINNASVILVEVLDKDRITSDDLIGSCTIDLREMQSMGGIRRWFPLVHKGKPAGDLLLEGFIHGSKYASTAYSSGAYGSGFNYSADRAYVGGQAWEGAWNLNTQMDFFNRYRTESQQSRFYTEQKQFIENRTFMREVDVVETVPVQKQVEMLEPHKVLRDVQYTQAVPVTRQIETVEPVVVQREVQVIEPRLVTKEIQVIENVPVKRTVDVLEMRSRVQDVQTMEPQTFHKQVAVTEHVPVMRNVTVTEPHTVRKTVEYVEPVITTQTITKEVVQPVVVDQRITTEVGPATLVSIHTDIHKEFAHLSLAERERLIQYQQQMRISGGSQYVGNLQSGSQYAGNLQSGSQYAGNLQSGSQYGGNLQSGMVSGSRVSGNLQSGMAGTVQSEVTRTTVTSTNTTSGAGMRDPLNTNQYPTA